MMTPFFDLTAQQWDARADAAYAGNDPEFLKILNEIAAFDAAEEEQALNEIIAFEAKKTHHAQ